MHNIVPDMLEQRCAAHILFSLSQPKIRCNNVVELLDNVVITT